ncbi:hypothetical protein UFOVP257_188 [uncultured Caudovirales phage]|uniref:Uncharacterized protein n=1 Tax=uncultured Caudovirales phage TaxID=2100421 RepID=A0A6J5LNZ5_9CAUD|nr:hypothetical protein UFOVP257_188 [uncultured Caudovirales phage]
MISYHRFTELLHELFLKPLFLDSAGFTPSHTTSVENFNPLEWNRIKQLSEYQVNGKCIWWHEEPLNLQDLENLQWRTIHPSYHLPNPHFHDHPLNVLATAQSDPLFDVNFQVFANSEISQLKKSWLKEYPYYDWYFFFHGFAALDWYRDFKYLDSSDIEISKVFICLNHIINNNRSYRLYLLSQLKSNNIESHGFISAPLLSPNLIKTELYDKNSRLSSTAKKHIFHNLLPTAHNIILDHDTDYNFASADIIDAKYAYGSFWHIITETVFYDDKLHLTEKIFKPIVIGRPFILIGAVGNLAYLRRYGFKTFGQWIDESYDDEPDSDIRLLMIIKELKRLCNMSSNELNEMYNEMQSVLEYNKQHFFGDFKEILVDELIDNFKKCVFLHNRDKSERYQIPEQNLNYKNIKKILLS